MAALRLSVFNAQFLNVRLARSIKIVFALSHAVWSHNRRNQPKGLSRFRSPMQDDTLALALNQDIEEI